MKVKVTKIKIEVNDISDVLDYGNYQGIWSGYTVVINHNNTKTFIDVNKGIRGLNIPCWVSITETGIEIEK